MGIVVLRLLVRQAMYGEWVPNTYQLKVAGIPRHLLLERGSLSVGYTLAFGLVVPIALAVFAFVGMRGPRLVATGLLGGIVVGQLLYTVFAGGDAWERLGFADRFVATAMAPLMVLAAIGVATLSQVRTAPKRGLALAWLVAGSLLLVTVVFALVAPRRDRSFDLGHGSTLAWVLRIALVLTTVWLVTVAIRRRASWATVCLAAMLLVAPNLVPIGEWAMSNYQERSWDVGALSTSESLRSLTEPDTTIATPAIGSAGWFSEREIVDVLGKIDPVVASSRPHLDDGFVPGHVRWDYGHSYGALRPDVIAGSWRMTPEQVGKLSTWGYAVLNPGAFLLVHEDGRVRP